MKEVVINSFKHVSITAALILALNLITFTDAAGQFKQTNSHYSQTAFVPSSESADDPIPDNDSTVGVQGGRYGIGFGSAWPAYGISGTLQMNQTITVEAVLGLFGTVTNFGGRLWYRFNQNEKYDLYGYGAVGVYRYSARVLGIGVSENVLGLGAGAGIEAGIAKLFDDEELPPIFLNAELGLAFGSFEYYGGFSTLSFGFGAHYRFGEKG